jgi:diguanylate cyclase (GGDEF)-like protein
VLSIGIDGVDNLLDALSLRGIDKLLAALGSLLADQLDDQDCIARFGDFSFIVLAQRSQETEISALAEKLARTVENQLFELEEKALSIAVSIGVYLVRGSSSDAARCVEHAEKAYRIARDAGGNRVHAYVPGALKDKKGKKSQWLEELMAVALEKDGFEALFQPIVPLRGGEGEHYQTLLRLRGEDGEFIPAAEFIPVAESSDLILRLDRWITQYGLNVIKDRKQHGGKIHLFISQSLASLNDPGRPDWLQQQIERLQLSGTELTFEFGVGAVAADLNLTKNRFEVLQSMGISVLITRVTAESAHKKLIERLRPDYVKLAVEPLVGKQEELAALIEEIHDMGTPVIAPRIENPQVIAQLWISGVDFIQGNFIQRPDQKLGYDFSESILA